jgi:hypothetical protein
VVHRPRQGLGWRLGYRVFVSFDLAATSSPRVKLEEVDGGVVLKQGQTPIPLEELEHQLPAWADVLELPRSPVWTVQDAISICATFPRVRCALSRP